MTIMSLKLGHLKLAKVGIFPNNMSKNAGSVLLSPNVHLSESGDDPRRMRTEKALEKTLINSKPKSTHRATAANAARSPSPSYATLNSQ